MSEQTILASDLRVITRYLSSQQCDPEVALSAAGIPLDTLSEPRGRVPATQVGALLAQLADQFPDANLGLELAAHHHLTDTHVLGITAIASDTALDTATGALSSAGLVSGAAEHL